MARMENSAIISDYFTAVKNIAPNESIIEAIKHSATIYESEWFTSYNLRVQHMKDNLQSQLSEINFDLKHDKLLAKMGALHLSKGFSLWGTYEIGNTFNELASYYGNTALNIIFLSRYFEEDGTVKDLMDSKDKRNIRLNALRQHGKKDEWIVIDLKPMVRKYVSQTADYRFNKYVEEYLKTYDLVIIPKVEIDPTPLSK